MSVWCIVLAGGSGDRFGAPKQFAPLGGRSLVERAVTVAASASDHVVLVLPEGTRWTGPPVTAVQPGGATRSASVRNGLAGVPDSAGVIVIHDAAHPLATVALHQAVVAAVRTGAPAAAPTIPIAEALIRREGDLAVAAVPRAGLVLCQTPHAFRPEVLRALHAGVPEGSDEVTMLVERGTGVALVAGDPANIHVTTPDELALAERLVRSGTGRRGTDG